MAKQSALTKGQRTLLENLYFTPRQAGSLSSAAALRRALLKRERRRRRGRRGIAIKVPSESQIKEWLLEKRAFTVHRPARKKYKMKSVIVGGVNIQLQADLVDMQPWASENDGFRYILLAIDCFSRFAYSRPLKKKDGESTADALRDILNEAEKRIERKIERIQADQGKEFYNKAVERMLRERNVTLFSTKSPVKAQMVERLIRTLRTRQERFNTHKGRRRWLESFPDIVKSYNKMGHSALPKGASPGDVGLENERKVWKHLYEETLLTTPKSLQKRLTALREGKGLKLSSAKNELTMGDPVRLSKRKRTFEKAYFQNWTDEIFYVAHVSETSPRTFRIADESGELLEGVFYREELSPVRFPREKGEEKGKIFAIEKILDEEIRKDGKKYLLVKWRGYSDKENRWVRADQFAAVGRAA